jgi:hypothetical protein
MSQPKKGKRPRVKRSLVRRCQILRVVQSPFAWIFWQIESAIARIDIEIERLS